MTKNILAWLRNRIQKGSITDAATLDITDKKDASVEVSKVIIGVMRVNEDGELEPLGTWTQDQIFQGNIQIDGVIVLGTNTVIREEAGTLGVEFLDLTLTDYQDLYCHQLLCDGEQAVGHTDDYIDLGDTTHAIRIPRMNTAARNALTAVEGMVVYDSQLDRVFVYADLGWHELAHEGLPVTGDLETTGDVIVGDDVILGIGQRVEFEPGTYMYAQADNNLRFYAGGVWVLTITPTQFSMRQLIESTNNIRHAAIASPGATANWSKCYGHDVGGVNHFHAVTENGDEFDLTPGGAPWSGTFNNADGDTVTVMDGKITDIS